MASAANGGGTKDESHVGCGLRHGLLDGVEDRNFFLKQGTAASRSDPGDHVGAVGHAVAGVKTALPAGNTLHHNASVFVYQNTHSGMLQFSGFLNRSVA